jgi:elongation factor G
VVAHIDAGKTTTSEQMLFLGGQTKTIGRVDTGDTVLDFLPQERERGITISSSAISFQWKDKKINLIDTPGHVDFTIEVERSARVLDGAVVIVDAVSGVQAQTKTVWKQTKKQSIPAIAFINKMDRDGASFERALESIRTKLDVNAVPIQLPIGCEKEFIGLVDLLSMSVLTFDTTPQTSRSPRAPKVEVLNDTHSMYDDAVIARKKMIESVAEVDDILMEKYLETDNEGGDIKINDLISALRRTCIKGDIIPTICGASLRCKGVEPLLDSIVTFLPSPQDRMNNVAVHKKNGTKLSISPGSKDLCALAFKVVHDPMKGSLVYLRTYSGSLEAKQVLFNSTRGVKERLNQLLLVSADDFVPVQSVGPGSVACVVGLKGTFTGDTLVADKGPLQDYVLDGLTVPPAVFSLAVEPDKSSQQAELDKALGILSMEDPSLRVDIDKESGQTILRGIGELHLEIVCDKIRRQFNIGVTTGRAYVNYRESINPDDGVINKNHTYDRTFNFKRMYASIDFEVTPVGGSQEPTFIILDDVKKAMSNDEHASMEEGLRGSFSRGPQGFPVVGMHIVVVSILKDQDTTPGSIRACISLFMDTLLKSDSKIILEPYMALEVEAPSGSFFIFLFRFYRKKKYTQ